MNIQTIPRKDKIIKAAFFPKLDYLLFADYSQIEYRLFAWYMAMQVDDWRGVEAYHEGVDFHEAQAIRIHEAMGWEYTGEDAQRQIGKTSNFAAVYSGGIPTIQRQLGCDKRTARQIADAFHNDNPGLGRWKWEGRGFSDPDPASLNGQLVSTHGLYRHRPWPEERICRERGWDESDRSLRDLEVQTQGGTNG